jgi:clan AA aspartic protease
MGRVMPKIKLTNFNDVENARLGLRPPEEVRSVEVVALVDTGATQLVLTPEICDQLGLVPRGTRKVRYADGRGGEIPWVGGVLFEILGREMVCDALVQANATAPLIGQIPLEGLDLIVDPKSREVHVNPASPDMPTLDMLAAS